MGFFIVTLIVISMLLCELYQSREEADHPDTGGR